MQDTPVEILLEIASNCDARTFYRLRQTCRKMKAFTDNDYFGICCDYVKTEDQKILTIFDTYCELMISGRDPYRLLRSNIRIRLYNYFLEKRLNYMQVVDRVAEAWRTGRYERIIFWREGVIIQINYGLRNLRHKIYINSILYVDTVSYRPRRGLISAKFIKDWNDEHKGLAEEISKVVGI